MLCNAPFWFPGKKTFSYRGCGWKSGDHDLKSWTDEKKTWIIVVCDLFEQMFGTDFLKYDYEKDHGGKVDDGLSSSLLEYCHEYWERHYSLDAGEPHDDNKHHCYPRANLNADDVLQLVQKQQSAPRHKNSDASSAKFDSPVIEAQGNPPTAEPMKPQGDEDESANIDTGTNQQPKEEQSPTLTYTKRSNNAHSNSLNCRPSPKIVDSATVIIEDECNSKASQQTSLQVAIAKATTRAEVAALYTLIPKIASRSLSAQLKPVYGNPPISDPFSIAERPCESDIQKANKIIHDERKAGRNPSGVEIQGIGQFAENALPILQRFCAIADTYHRVSAEADWLSQMMCSPGDLVQLQDALWHHPASQPILKHGNKRLDTTSFSDLVEERYIDSFVIDICISKFLEESKESGNNFTVYFPTEFYDWMSSNDKQFQQHQLGERLKLLRNIDDLKQILVPVYMPSHWGLIFVDVANRMLYFDDGLNSNAPRLALASVKRSLELLLEMYPCHTSLQTRFWREYLGFQRFGMPSQTPINSKMIGVGSCGIGVIMAAKDFILKGPLVIHNFQWRYCDMDLHRKQLMMQILNWSVQA